MELNQLQIFCVAAETLNFTKAGLQLGYAQSNITGQIKQLEESLQIKLFERMGRSIQLTSEGAQFLQSAKAILQLCERAKEEFSPHTFRGILNIGAAETACVHRLPKILTTYRKLYPLVEIRVHTAVCDDFFSLIKTNQIDIALMLTDKIKATEMIVKTLYDENLVLVGSPHHPLAQSPRILPEDLKDECLIITLPGCGYRPLILAMLRNHLVWSKSLMELSSIAAIKECASCGLGVTFLPKITVKNELDKGKLVELNWAGPNFDVKTQLMYHHEKWVTSAMRSFLALCTEYGTGACG